MKPPLTGVRVVEFEGIGLGPDKHLDAPTFSVAGDVREADLSAAVPEPAAAV